LRVKVLVVFSSWFIFRTIYLNASGVAVIDHSFANNIRNANSSIYSVSLDKETFNTEEIGENWVTVTAIDMNGNRHCYASIVTVMDTLKPVVKCKDTTVYLNAFGVAVIDNSFINNGSRDNSSIYSMSLDENYFSYEEIGENWVTITATDINGNTDYCTSIVTVIDTLIPIVNFKNNTVDAFVPNAFTPNNDGVNDVFIPVNSNYAIKNYEFSVYNLRSEVLFKTNSNSEGWNGNFRGVEIPEGDYIWTLTTSSKSGNNTQSQKGYVKLIR